MASETIRLEIKLKDGKVVSKELRGVEDPLKKIPGHADQASSSLGRLKTAYRLLGTAGIAMVAKKIAAMGAEFEYSMLTIKAVTGATAKAIAKIEVEARRLGASTAYSAKQAADAMINLARAGMKTAKIVATAEHALKLAGAQATSMAEASKYLVSTLAQFELKANQAKRVADSLAFTASNALTDLTGLGGALTYAGTAAGSFDHSLENTLAILAKLHDLGLEGTLAGNYLKMSLQALIRPSDNANKILQRLGVTYKEINPSAHEFTEILERFSETSIIAGEAAEIFGGRAGLAMYKIIDKIREGEINFEKFIEAMKKAQGGIGIAAKQYAEMTSGAKGQWDILMSGMAEMGLKMWDILKVPLGELLWTSNSIVAAINMTLEAMSRPEVRAWQQAGGWKFGAPMGSLGRVRTPETFGPQYPAVELKDITIDSLLKIAKTREVEMNRLKYISGGYKQSERWTEGAAGLRPGIPSPLGGDMGVPKLPSLIPGISMEDALEGADQHYQYLDQKYDDLDTLFSGAMDRSSEKAIMLKNSAAMMGDAFGNAFAMMSSGATGAGDAMSKSMLGALGQIASMWGRFLMFTGTGLSFLPGGQTAAGAIGYGLALQALGGTISGLAGRVGGGAGSGGGYGGGGGYTGGGQAATKLEIIVVDSAGRTSDGGTDVRRALNRAGLDRQVIGVIEERLRSGQVRGL